MIYGIAFLLMLSVLFNIFLFCVVCSLRDSVDFYKGLANPMMTDEDRLEYLTDYLKENHGK